MDIRDDILQALEALAEESGSPTELARRLAVNRSTVERWLHGETKTINDVIWTHRVYPAIKHYLTRDTEEAQKYFPSSQTPNVSAIPPASREAALDKLSVDERLILKKYEQLTTKQQEKLHEFIDNLILNNRMDQFKAFGVSEAPAEYQTKRKK